MDALLAPMICSVLVVLWLCCTRRPATFRGLNTVYWAKLTTSSPSPVSCQLATACSCAWPCDQVDVAVRCRCCLSAQVGCSPHPPLWSYLLAMLRLPLVPLRCLSLFLSVIVPCRHRPFLLILTLSLQCPFVRQLTGVRNACANFPLNHFFCPALHFMDAELAPLPQSCILHLGLLHVSHGQCIGTFAK
jgi:hypothetical protein